MNKKGMIPMRISKKILACVLAAMMAISMMPFTVLAAEATASTGSEFTSAISSASSGDTIKLTDNIELTSNITLYKDLTFDLNGYTATMNVTSGMNGAIKLNSGTLTIKDSSANQDGNMNITSGAGSVTAIGFYVTGGNLTIESGNVTVVNPVAADYWSSKGVYAVRISSGTFNMTGGSLTASNANASGKASYAVSLTGGTANISGGSVTINDVSGSGWSDYHFVDGSGTVNITGGRFKTTNDYYASNEYYGLRTKLSSAYALGGADADGFRPIVHVVAKVGTTLYRNFETAIAAARTGDNKTVVVLDNIDLTQYPAYGSAGSMHYIDISGVTVDLNDHTMTIGGRWSTLFSGTNGKIMNGTCVGTPSPANYQYGLYIWGPGSGNVANSGGQHASIELEDLTLNCGLHTWNADVTVTDCDATGSASYYAVWADENSNVTIESGNFTTAGAAVIGCAKSSDGNGNIAVKGGNFTVPAGKPLVLGASKTSIPTNAVISGGFYHYADESVYEVLSNNVANGYKQNMETGEVIPDEDVDTMSITIEDSIDLNIYVADSADEIATIEFSYNTTPGVEENNQDTTVVPAEKNADGKIALKVDLAPAQIMDEIKVVAKNSSGETVKTIETSVADYCNTIINNTGFTQELKDLAVSTLDYGKAASDYFNYNTAAFDSYENQFGTADLSGVTQSASNWLNNSYFALTGVSYVATSVPELRFYIDMTTTTENYLTELNGLIETNIGTARFVKDANGNKMLQIKGIDITNFNELIVVKFKDSETELLKFTPITWVKAAQNDAQLDDLANAIGNYYLKSVAYFE
jgi:hypothetical protein